MIGKIINFVKNKKRIKSLKKSMPDMLYGYYQKGVFLKDTRVGSATTIVAKENLILEDNVFIGQYNFIEASNGITINEGCQITNYISIVSHSSHNSIRYYGKEYRTTKDLKGYVRGSVEIGKYSFIGPHVTIMPNTILGKGCIVSAFSLVKGEFPDFSIIAGNPAKIVGSTLEKDKSFLNNNPELQDLYNAWAQK